MRTHAKDLIELALTNLTYARLEIAIMAPSGGAEARIAAYLNSVRNNLAALMQATLEQTAIEGLSSSQPADREASSMAGDFGLAALADGEPAAFSGPEINQ
jgi:hypothetical protein